MAGSSIAHNPDTDNNPSHLNTSIKADLNANGKEKNPQKTSFRLHKREERRFLSRPESNSAVIRRPMIEPVKRVTP